MHFISKRFLLSHEYHQLHIVIYLSIFESSNVEKIVRIQ